MRDAWQHVLNVIEDSNSSLDDFLQRLRDTGQFGNQPAASPRFSPEAGGAAMRPSAGGSILPAVHDDRSGLQINVYGVDPRDRGQVRTAMTEGAFELQRAGLA